MLSLVGACGLGFLLGIRHAFEPDHLAAVSTLVVERASPRRAAWLGACWGLGHTLGLVVVALVLALLRARMSDRMSDGFELLVAVMLLALGARSLLRSVRDARIGAPHPHAHGARGHLHEGPSAHVHVGRTTMALRPLLVGTVHGLAGSGALTAVALARMPSLASALSYVLLFGLGSLGSMALLSVAAGWPLERLLLRSPRARTLLVGATGAFAVVLGLLWGWSTARHLVGA